MGGPPGRRAAAEPGDLSRRLALIVGPAEVLQLYRSFARATGAGFAPAGAILPGCSLQAPDGEDPGSPAWAG